MKSQLEDRGLHHCVFIVIHRDSIISEAVEEPSKDLQKAHKACGHGTRMGTVDGEVAARDGLLSMDWMEMKMAEITV